MRLISAFVATLALCATAVAAEPMTVEQVIIIGNGLSQLDGYEGVCKDGSSEKPCHRTYDFTASTKMAIALNLVECRRIIQAYQTVTAQLKAKYPNKDDAAKLDLENREILDKPADVRLARIPKVDLKLDVNKDLPITTLSSILAIVDQ